MAVAHVASVEASTPNPTTSGSITIPGGVVAGDLLIVFIVSKEHAGTPFVSVTDNDTGGNTWNRYADASSPDGESNVYWKIATSGTAGKTISWSGAQNSSAGVLSVYSGADDTTPLTDGTTEFNSAGNETQAGITPSQADSMICVVVFNIDDNITVSSQAVTNPGALTEREDDQSTGGGDSSVNHASALQSGGPSATGAFTWSQADGLTRSAIFAIKPSAGSGVTGSLSPTLSGASADIDAVEAIPGELDPATAGAQADLDGVVANPVTGALDADTSGATSDLDAVETIPGEVDASLEGASAALEGQVSDETTGELDAVTEGVQSDFDGVETFSCSVSAQAGPATSEFEGVVAVPVEGTLDTTLDGATANLDGIGGEVEPARTGGAFRGDWRRWLKEFLAKKEPKEREARSPRRVRVSGFAEIAAIEASAAATVTHHRRIEGAAELDAPALLGVAVRHMAVHFEVAGPELSAEAEARIYMDKDGVERVARRVAAEQRDDLLAFAMSDGPDFF